MASLWLAIDGQPDPSRYTHRAVMPASSSSVLSVDDDSSHGATGGSSVEDEIMTLHD